MRGDPFDYWTGIVTGLARMGIVSRGGKATSFAGLTAGAWFGEGTVLKNEPRRYDVVALRDTRLALMDRSHLLLAVREQRRLQPLPGRGSSTSGSASSSALLEYGRTLDATGRVSRAASPRCSTRFSIRT